MQDDSTCSQHIQPQWIGNQLRHDSQQAQMHAFIKLILNRILLIMKEFHSNALTGDDQFRRRWSELYIHSSGDESSDDNADT